MFLLCSNVRVIVEMDVGCWRLFSKNCENTRLIDLLFIKLLYAEINMCHAENHVVCTLMAAIGVRVDAIAICRWFG